jgi:uncharacterized zinc-type alcohol dehydrogenase-like protein
LGVAVRSRQHLTVGPAHGRRAISASFIGGFPETRQINQAYERMARSDVKYRFVIDMASLKS